MTIVDSSSWIEALREQGKSEVRSRVERLLDVGDAAWCSMIQLELWRGARSAEERRLLLFLDSRITRLEINEAIWKSAIQLMTKARAGGLTAPSADVLIVATAKYHGVDIEHCDKHMDQLLKFV